MIAVLQKKERVRVRQVIKTKILFQKETTKNRKMKQTNNGRRRK